MKFVAKFDRIATQTHFFVLAGQSNAEGDGSTTFSYDFQRTQTFFKTVYNDSTPGAFVDLQFGVTNSTDASQIDPEPEPLVYIAQQFEESRSAQLRTVKVAFGGTNFRGGNGSWAAGRPLSTALFNNYITPALTALQAAGADIRVMPPFWIQGESDADALDRAQAYQAQCQTFFTNLRSTIGIPALPIVALRLNSACSSAFTAQLQAAQDAIAAADPNVYLINPDDLPLVGGLHYTAAGYQAIATRYLALADAIGTVPAGDL